jgi:uncharacterized protein (DUF488 family)
MITGSTTKRAQELGAPTYDDLKLRQVQHREIPQRGIDIAKLPLVQRTKISAACTIKGLVDKIPGGSYNLDKLDPGEVAYELGSEAVLLCWEAPGRFCHRRLVATWLEEALGVDVPECAIARS